MENRFEEPDLSFVVAMLLFAATFSIIPITINTDKVIVGMFVFAVIGWIGVFSLHFAMKKRWKAVVDIKSTFLTEEIIDQRLRDLAISLDNLCKAQISLQSENSMDSSLDTMTENIKRLKSGITVAKSSFWEAQELAKDLGFRTHHEYKFSLL